MLGWPGGVVSKYLDEVGDTLGGSLFACRESHLASHVIPVPVRDASREGGPWTASKCTAGAAGLGSGPTGGTGANWSCIGRGTVNRGAAGDAR